jgi:hypothetical protein
MTARNDLTNGLAHGDVTLLHIHDNGVMTNILTLRSAGGGGVFSDGFDEAMSQALLIYANGMGLGALLSVKQNVADAFQRINTVAPLSISGHNIVTLCGLFVPSSVAGGAA